LSKKGPRDGVWEKNEVLLRYGPGRRRSGGKNTYWRIRGKKGGRGQSTEGTNSAAARRKSNTGSQIRKDELHEVSGIVRYHNEEKNLFLSVPKEEQSERQHKRRRVNRL